MADHGTGRPSSRQADGCCRSWLQVKHGKTELFAVRIARFGAVFCKIMQRLNFGAVHDIARRFADAYRAGAVAAATGQR